MKRVPRGYNARVTRMASQTIELVRRHVVPVYRVDAQQRPDLEGTGTLVKKGGRHLLVSAAHVFEPLLRDGIHLLIEGRAQNALAQPVHMTQARDNKPRVYDDFDIGFVELTDDEVSGLGIDNFVSEPESEVPTRQWWHEHFVLGYPLKSQHRDENVLTYQHKQTYYVAPEATLSSYKSCSLSRQTTVLVGFDHRRIKHEEGAGGRPNFKGMSGGGIWLWDTHRTYLPNDPPQLVGFLAGSPRHNGKVLFGSRIVVLNDIMFRVYDRHDA
jgi:hypothetical protein